MTPNDDILDRAAAAALALATTKAWRDISLRDIADAAETPFAALYEAAPAKGAILSHLSQRFDHAALSAEVSGEPRERLFETIMARIEVMEPNRAALVAIAAGAGRLAMAQHLPPAARACLEAAGVEATAPRLAATAALLARLFQIWRYDEPGLGKTMAELDRRLPQLQSALARIGAGF